MKDIRRGEVYFVVKGKEYGSEQQAGRPAIIVSNNVNNANSPTVEVVYLTTQPKADLPTHCEVLSTGCTATALCEQISTVHKDRLERFVSALTDDELDQVEHCMKVSLGISDPASVRVAYKPSAELLAERDFYKRQYNELLDKLVGGFAR